MTSTQRRILVVDDDDLVRKTVRLGCEPEGFVVDEAASGAAALAAIEEGRPDVVLLDVMLPDQSGFDVCRELRRRGHRMPVVMLSARHDEIDVVVGLEIGADDYVGKPFRPRELLARIAAQLRRSRESETAEGGRRLFRDLVIDIDERRCYRNGHEVLLTHTEFDLLSFFANNPGRVCPREEILAAVWGYQYPIETRVIDVHVRNLRRKLEPDPAHPAVILAVPGIGYRFSAPRR